MKEILPQTDRKIATGEQVQKFNDLIDNITNPAHAEPHGGMSWSVSDSILGLIANLQIVGNTDGENIHLRSLTQKFRRGESVYEITYLSNGATQEIAEYLFIDVKFDDNTPESVKLDINSRKTMTPRVLRNRSIVKSATKELAEEVINELEIFNRKHKAQRQRYSVA